MLFPLRYIDKRYSAGARESTGLGRALNRFRSRANDRRAGGYPPPCLANPIDDVAIGETRLSLETTMS